MEALIARFVELGILTFDHAVIYGGYTSEAEFGKAFYKLKSPEKICNLFPNVEYNSPVILVRSCLTITPIPKIILLTKWKTPCKIYKFIFWIYYCFIDLAP